MEIILPFVFVIVFAVSVIALKESPLAGGRYVLGLCVAGLAVIGLLDSRLPMAALFPAMSVDFLLLPYVALALAVPLVLLMKLFSSIGSSRRDRNQYERFSRDEDTRRRDQTRARASRTDGEPDFSFRSRRGQ